MTKLGQSQNWAGVLAVLLVAACGGGGSEGQNPAGQAGATNATGASGGAGLAGAAAPGGGATGTGTPTAGGAPVAGASSGGSAGTNAMAGSSAAVAGSAGLSAGGASGSSGDISSGAGGTAPVAGAAGAAGTGGESDPGVAATGITGLTVEPNPNSVLSAFVSWTTDQAASSAVQFGEGGYTWEISDAALVTEHRVLVIGMHASTAYMIKAISENSGGSVSGETEFTTGQLPAPIPEGTVMINDTARAQPGWTLMNVQAGNGTTNARSEYPPYAVMYDEDGRAVWYYIDTMNPDIGGAVSTDLTDVGVLIGPTWNMSLTTGIRPREVDFAGDLVWECSNEVCGGSKSVSHHAGKLSNGNYVINEDNSAGGGVTSPLFQEVTPDNQVVWSLDWNDFVPPPQGANGDWCHGNSITIDIDNNEVYANCRWVGLLKTTYDNPTYEWLLPASYGGQGLGDITFMPSGSQFSDTHDPEIHADGTILFYDNGGYSGGTGGNTMQYHSRAVEYQIDETGMTATLVWEYPGSYTVPDSWYTDSWYSPFWGDADRLDNGNVLVTAGIRSPSIESRVFEVTKEDGVVVWEFRFPPDYGVYRADRITPPLVHPVAP